MKKRCARHKVFRCRCYTDQHIVSAVFIVDQVLLALAAPAVKKAHRIIIECGDLLQRKLIIFRFHARIVFRLRHAAQHHRHAERRTPHVLQRRSHGVIFRTGDIQKLDRREHARAVIARVAQLLTCFRLPRVHVFLVNAAKHAAGRAEVIVRFTGI